MTTGKKALWISLISVDVAITLFLFVVSIIMLATMPDTTTLNNWKQTGNYPNFICYLQANPTVYLCVGVIPLFVLLALNVWGVIYYAKKFGARKKVALNELSAEQKEALRQELLNDLKEDNENK